jgi:hypothetical protein
LKIVQQTNQENVELAALIAQVEGGEMPEIQTSSTDAPVSDPAVAPGDNTTVQSGEDLESDLVSPVNTVPANEDETSENQAE